MNFLKKNKKSLIKSYSWKIKDIFSPSNFVTAPTLNNAKMICYSKKVSLGISGWLSTLAHTKKKSVLLPQKGN